MYSNKQTDTTKIVNQNETHAIRKELKLLILSNMKMKKQLRVSRRVRYHNRLRLENNIQRLNSLVFEIFNNAFESNQNDNVDSKYFSNPIQSTDEAVLSVLKTKNILKDYKFYCDKCSFKSRKKTPFDIHMRRHEKVRLYSCELCPQTFITQTELKGHLPKHQKGKIYWCDLCPYSTHNSHVLVSHKERIHLTNKTYLCNACHFTTQDRSEWLNHKTSNPSHRADTTCSACKDLKMRLKSGYQPLGSGNLNLMWRKYDISHTCGKRWSCQKCGLLFGTSDSLKKHQTIHTLEKKYKCDICQYTAVTKHSLVTHIRIHSGEKPYRCTECSFSCSTKSYMTVHINNHKGIKPYTCDQCSYRSANSSKISAHKKKMHEINDSKPGRKPRSFKINNRNKFMCKYCGMLFNRMAVLGNHEEEHIIDIQATSDGNYINL